MCKHNCNKMRKWPYIDSVSLACSHTMVCKQPEYVLSKLEVCLVMTALNVCRRIIVCKGLPTP